MQTSREQTSAVSRYISHVRQIPELSREEEAALARAFRLEGNQDAAARLALANLRHVVSIAVSYRRYGIPLAELIAEGNFGIVHAIRKYDPERGNRFVTYAAYWIRAYILNHVIHSWSLVGVGSGPLRSKMFFRLRRERAPSSKTLASSETSRASSRRAISRTFSAGAPNFSASIRSPASPSPTSPAIRARSRRSRKNIFERSGPDPTPTRLHEWMTWLRMYALIQ